MFLPCKGYARRPTVLESRCVGRLRRELRHGSQAECGTPAAALLDSLLESAKLCGIEPRAYLGEATLRAVRNPGTATLARDLKSPES